MERHSLDRAASRRNGTTHGAADVSTSAMLPIHSRCKASAFLYMKGRRPKAAYAPSPTRGEGKKSPSIRPEHELAVAFKIRPGAHIELAVLADEEKRALRHFL